MKNLKQKKALYRITMTHKCGQRLARKELRKFVKMIGIYLRKNPNVSLKLGTIEIELFG